MFGATVRAMIFVGVADVDDAEVIRRQGGATLSTPSAAEIALRLTGDIFYVAS